MSHAFEPLTPTAFLRRSALVHGERTALVDGATRLTYAELERRTLGLAGSLAARLSFVTEGVTKDDHGGTGERVAVLATNSQPLLEAPDCYEFRSELPKTATGKVRKFLLREEARAM